MTARPAIALAGLLAALYIVLLAGGLGGSLGVVLLAAGASYAVDWGLRARPNRRVTALLNRIGAAITWRFFYRRLLLLVFLVACRRLSRTELTIVVVAVVVHHVETMTFTAMRSMVAARRLRRLETRNLAVPGSDLPEPPPAWLGAAGPKRLQLTDLFLLAALAWAFVTNSYSLVAPAAVLMVVAAGVFPLALLGPLLALRRLPGDDERMAAAQEAVLALGPTVLLYFSGGVRSVYQVNMWLETMEQLERPVLVLLRERRYLSRLSETTTPVLCLPFAADLMNFQMPSARVGLYVANVGKNIHLLRVPTIKSAFIGHGDSDKTASFNPYSKVYDEVWVAGEAGRQRYLRAQVGVRSDQIVAVGRPQLDGIAQARPTASDAPLASGDRPFTVLYAPTWEGWTEDPFSSSLVLAGRQIVSTLLATPGIRVIYKPHPLTGTVQSAARQANADVIALIEAAGPAHVNVLDLTPLYDCFNDSDALISDISSVVSDYLKSEKPYFVTNLADEPAETFREQNASAGAAYLIGPEIAGLTEGLAAARTSDPMRERRHEVSAYLLGDPDVDSLSRFRAAVDALVAVSDAHQAVFVSEGDDDQIEADAAGPDTIEPDAGEGPVGGDDGA